MKETLIEAITAFHRACRMAFWNEAEAKARLIAEYEREAVWSELQDRIQDAKDHHDEIVRDRVNNSGHKAD